MGLFDIPEPAPPKRGRVTACPPPQAAPIPAPAPADPLAAYAGKTIVPEAVTPPARKGRVAIRQEEGFFGENALPPPGEQRLTPLRDGCRGRAMFTDPNDIWNKPEAPPGLKLRHELWRDWGEEDAPLAPHVCFVGMNPAYADAERDDHTVRCYMEFTSRLGYESFVAMNVCPIVSPDPAVLTDPAYASWLITGANQSILSSRCVYARRVILCFGSLPKGHKTRMEAERLVGCLQMAHHPMWCYGVTADGSPRHLSRLAHNTPIQPFYGW